MRLLLVSLCIFAKGKSVFFITLFVPLFRLVEKCDHKWKVEQFTSRLAA